MNNPGIKLVDISVGYLAETVIRGLSIDIAHGEITGIFGPNGAGKTTLLCAVNGLAAVSSGRVFIRGREFTVFNQNMMRRQIGYVPQHFDIDPKLPVIAEEVVMMGRYGKLGFFRFAGSREKELMAKLAGELDIKHLLKKPFGQLSGGEKKRVLIARALMKEPDILLLDEMFAWLDLNMVSRFTCLIREIHAKKNITILIVSHDLGVVESLCSRVIWMENGKIAFDGGREEFLAGVKKKNGVN